MIRAKNISKSFQDLEAVRSVSFTVNPGEILALIGTSGSGKTTILRMLNGLVQRSAGDILVNGSSIDSVSKVQLRRNMGYVIQQVGLFPHYTVARNIGVMWEIQGVKPDTDRILSLLDMLGVSREMADKFPNQLSGGQQQRIGIARALATDPEVLLMDEPFGSLDPITRHDIQNEFRRLPNIRSKAVVLVTHDLKEAALLGSRICLLDKGEVQQTGTLRELLFRPASNFVKSFLDKNRISLEWRAVTLKDMLPFLEMHPGEGPLLDEETTLAEILENNRKGSVRSGNERISVDPEQLLKLFYLNRQAIINRPSNE